MAVIGKLEGYFQSTAAKVVVGIIVVPFVLFGAEAIVSYTGTAETSINGYDVADRDRIVGYASAQAQAREENAPQLSESEILEQAQEYATRRALQRGLSQRFGIDGGGEVVGGYLSEVNLLQDDGSLDVAELENRAFRLGISNKSLVQVYADDAAIGAAFGAIAGTQFVLPEQLDKVVQLEQQTRDIQILRLRLEDFAAKVEDPDEASLLAWYQQNTNLFLEPERIELEVVVVDPSRLTVAEPSEDEILLALADRRALSADTEVSIDLEQRTAGTDEEWLLIEGLALEDLPENVADAISSLDVGEVSAPLSSDYSEEPIEYRIAARTGGASNFDEEGERVKAVAALEQAALDAAVYEQAQLIVDRATQGSELTDAASESGLVAVFVGPFEQGAVLPDQYGGAELLTDAWDRNSNEVNIYESSEGALVVYKVANREQPAALPFEQVTEEVGEAYRYDKAAERIDLLADEVAVSVLGEGVELKVAAAQHGSSAEILQGLPRWSSLVPQQVIVRIFNTPVGSNEAKLLDVATPSGSRFLVAVTGVRRGKPIEDDEIRTLKQSLNWSRSLAMLQQIVAGMEQE